MWRCPHCGAPQAESARCWVCHRSSTTCSTCRHFQTSLTSDVGWCALDPKRRSLTGLEQRGCWQEQSAVSAAPWADGPASQGPAALPDGAGLPSPRAHLDFVPVEQVQRTVARMEPAAPVETTTGPQAQPNPPSLSAGRDEAWSERTSLFGELEA